MNTQALVMPGYVAELVKLALAQLRLDVSEEHQDIIISSLDYEDGTALSLVIMCLAQRAWFREKPVLMVSIAELDDSIRASKVYFRETIPVPYGPSDLQFLIKLSAKVRAMAWTVAAITEMGECVSLPGRPTST